MRIHYDDRPCGAGKTHGELMYMVQNRGRYLLAVDQKRATRERANEIRELARKSGKRVPVVIIESGDHTEERRQDLTTIRVSQCVRSDITAAPIRHDAGHIIVIVTHEGLKLADLVEYWGWHLVIDETPSILDRQDLQTTLSREFFVEHYRLTPSGKRSKVLPASRATAADMRGDSLSSPLTVMHSRVLSERTEVLTDLRSWNELGEGRSWSWASIWSPEQLYIFDSVLILANAFRRSLTYAVLSSRWPEIEWVPHRRVALRRYQQRRMTIRYFAEFHSASRSLFSSDTGKERLAAISAWIAKEVDPRSHIWTCNEADLPAIGDHLRTPARLSPRQAGSNAYAYATCVTAIYTAKPGPSERALFRDLGVDPKVATESREYETIFQFACRCAVRDPASTANITVHVYDREQAEYLDELFAATGYVEPILELVDLGFEDTPPPPPNKPGRKPKAKSAAEQEAEKRRLRQQAAARKRRQRARKKTD